MIGFPKPTPYKLRKDKQDAADEALDQAESRKVRKRSKGRCEVTVAGCRCGRRAFEVHHHLGGWKRRGRGFSALAANKTHACTPCHREITGNVLEHAGGNRYRRVEG